MKSFYDEFEEFEKEYLQSAEDMVATDRQRAYKMTESVFEFYADWNLEPLFFDILCNYPNLSELWEEKAGS